MSPDSSVNHEARGRFPDLKSATSGGDLRHQRMNLEQQVRSALIVRSTQESLQISNSAECKAQIKQFAIDAFKKDDPDVTDAEVEEFLAEFEQLEYSPDKMLAQAVESGTKQWRTAEESKLTFAKFADTLRKALPASDESVFGQIIEIACPIVEFYETQDQIVLKLTDLAEDRGIEFASSLEAYNKVIQELYPTSNDYRSHLNGLLSSAETFLYKVAEILGSEGGVGKSIAEQSKFVADSAALISSPLIRKYVDSKIKQIYNE
jgi:hypothetical protein